MGEKVEEYDLNNKSLSIDTSYVKEEFGGDDHLDDKVCVWETILNINDTKADHPVEEVKININEIRIVGDIEMASSSLEMFERKINDNVKIENEIGPADVVKVEYGSKLLFCDNCHEYFQDYCIRCEMLVHILNRNTLGDNADDKAQEEIPMDILEIKFISGQLGIFAMKTIPEGVRFGPFTGLNTSECPRKIKRGKFIVSEDGPMFLNWMRHINPARNISEQNLLVRQCENNLYYYSIREIQVGEELLVHFGEEYEDSQNADVMDFFAPIENNMKDVFACTYCCLGFSSREHLVQHKGICEENGVAGRFSLEELIRCSWCHIYMGEAEYSKYHMAFCCQRNNRRCISLASNNRRIEARRERIQNRHLYKCTRCKYKTTHKNYLRRHANKHYVVKRYKCGIRYDKRFKTKKQEMHGNVDWDEAQKYSTKVAKHFKVHHNPKDEAKQFECPECKFLTKCKYNLKNHIKANHLKEFKYKCESCVYKTNRKEYLERHTNTKHLKEFKYKCEMCEFKVNETSKLKAHIKTKHLKEFNYMCEMCKYKTNYKSTFEKHIKTIHLKEFSYNCGSCEFRSNEKSHLEIHVKSKHLKEFNYKCEICEYKTNHKSKLENHMKTIHLKEYEYSCETCDYETNYKGYLERHIKTKHLNEFDYKCPSCEYKTYHKLKLERHIKTKHLKEFDYECESCSYKTNRKENIENHVKTKHLKEFNYKCGTCEFETNRKPTLDYHIKTKHLKEFDYKCEICEYKTNDRSKLEIHIKAKHLKEYDYKCEKCEYKTNRKSILEIHIKTKHLKEFDYKCAICEYKTNHKSKLQVHIKTKHLKEFDYKCDSCSYMANRKEQLENHIKTKHLKQFDLKCELCAYETNSKANLKIHTEKKHPQI